MSISLPFISKYLASASVFALTISNSLVIFSLILYLSEFWIASCLSYSADKIKSTYPISPGFIFTVFFNEITPSVVRPIFFDNGVEFFIEIGISKLFLPINFSLFISNSVSPIFSQLVCILDTKYNCCSFGSLFFRFTIKLLVSSSYS